MSIQKKVKKSLVQGNTTKVAGIELHKMTASSLTLCEQLNLGFVSGDGSKQSQLDVLLFIYLHFIGAREARELIFNEDMGVDSKGRSKAFLNACMDWADELSITNYTELAQGIGDMMREAFDGSIEIQDNKEGNEQKVA